jgi:periplasmic protein TonB
MKTNHRQRRQKKVMVFAGFAVLTFLCTVVWTVKALIRDDGSRHRRSIQMVTLIKPPPPPKIEEKPPEPVVKKEDIVEPEPEKAPQEADDTPKDEPPPGQNLGLDADGTGGSDAFGLLAKKGGHALIGGSGDRTLMQRYGWYTRLLQDEIRKKINEYMTKTGGIPQGEHKALIKIVLDPQGRIVDFELQERSGNEHMDDALRKTLASIRVTEAPPEGMPHAIRLKVSSKG